jgi:hypothetical protein
MDLGLARRPPPDPRDGRAATLGQLWVQEEPILPVQGGRDYSPRSASSRRRLLLRFPPSWSCRSGNGVAADLEVRRGAMARRRIFGFFFFFL